jgi:hypothetical protein
MADSPITCKNRAGEGGLLKECICGHKPEMGVTLTTIREYGIGENEVGGLSNAVTNFGAAQCSPAVFRGRSRVRFSPLKYVILTRFCDYPAKSVATLP